MSFFFLAKRMVNGVGLEDVVGCGRSGHCQPAVADVGAAGAPFAAIESAIGRESLAESIAHAKELTLPALDDHLALVNTQFTTLRRYTPEFLAVLDIRAAPAAQDWLDAINVIRALNAAGARKLRDDAPSCAREWKASEKHASPEIDGAV